MIVRRNGKYGVRVYQQGRQVWLGTYDRLGRPSEEGTARWAEARALRDGPGSRVTCDEWCARWLAEYPRESAATMRTYAYAVRRFARDFAGVPLGKLDRLTVRAWTVGKPQSTVRVLRAMFTDAVNDGLVNDNPFSRLGSDRRAKPPEWIPTELDVRDLADKALEVHGEAWGAVFRAMILWAAYTGMRPGEIFPLEWGDVDEARGVVRVDKSLDGTGKLNRHTKNKLTRTIALPPTAREALHSFRPLHDRLIFVTKTGHMFSKSQLALYWHPVRAAYGRPHMRFYDLRHFCATMLLERGVPPHDVAVQLGHTDGGALVMKTYGHPERSALGRLRAAFEADVVPINDRRRA